MLSALARAAGSVLLDLHLDAAHHRSVFTLVGLADQVEVAVCSLSRRAVELIDLRAHRGAHPRAGVVDVVPFVADPTQEGPPGELAVAARDRYARWAASELALPIFLYGPPETGRHAGCTGRTLPEVRRRAFVDLLPDLGPSRPDPRTGWVAVGARSPMVAYNVWVAKGDIALARSVATAVRGPGVRALGLVVGSRLQVSCNLIDPFHIGPAEAYDRISGALAAGGGSAGPGELVGLLPADVLRAVPAHRRQLLGLSDQDTIEHRLGELVRRR